MSLQQTDRYDDIINLPHHVSHRHPRMSRHQRAAQFMPFAALTGYARVIKQTAWPWATLPATPTLVPETPDFTQR